MAVLYTATVRATRGLSPQKTRTSGVECSRKHVLVCLCVVTHDTLRTELDTQPSQ